MQSLSEVMGRAQL